MSGVILFEIPLHHLRDERALARFNFPPRRPGQIVRANVAFQTTLIAALAGNAFRKKRHVPDFSGAAGDAAIKLSVDDHPAAHALRAQRHAK